MQQHCFTDLKTLRQGVTTGIFLSATFVVDDYLSQPIWASSAINLQRHSKLKVMPQVEINKSLCETSVNQFITKYNLK